MAEIRLDLPLPTWPTTATKDFSGIDRFILKHKQIYYSSTVDNMVDIRLYLPLPTRPITATRDFSGIDKFVDIGGIVDITI